MALIATAEKNNDGSAVSETTTADVADAIETVFIDAAGIDDANRDAKHSARGSYIVSNTTNEPALSIVKSIVSIIDTNGGNQAVTGSKVTYKIQVSSTGTGFINNLIITDPTPSNMSYQAASIKLNNAIQSDANDGSDNTNFGFTTANTATINLGIIPAGSLHEIQLTYTIN